MDTQWQPIGGKESRRRYFGPMGAAVLALAVTLAPAVATAFVHPIALGLDDRSERVTSGVAVLESRSGFEVRSALGGLGGDVADSVVFGEGTRDRRERKTARVRQQVLDRDRRGLRTIESREDR